MNSDDQDSLGIYLERLLHGDKQKFYLHCDYEREICFDSRVDWEIQAMLQYEPYKSQFHNATKKESTMSRTKFTAVGSLLAFVTADGLSKESVNLVSNNPKVKAALEAAQKKRKEESETLLGDALTEILNRLDGMKDEKRSVIRELRARIDREKKSMDEMDRALQYGLETMNFVPLMALMNVGYGELGITYSEFREHSSVPRDWKPTVTAVESESTASA